MSTDRGLPGAGNNKVPNIASSNAVPSTAAVPFKRVQTILSVTKAKCAQRIFLYTEFAKCRNGATKLCIIHVQCQFRIVEIIAKPTEYIQGPGKVSMHSKGLYNQ